ncbi:YcgJ family protein [Raoultella ornithinolytica]|uniref:YcgJ family protein n=1 Tax=Raoultella ornithinolytica TaxID=54291 RepID=UPI0021AE8A48|nr:YcgJ family protein [Raoultella ornithinolytica]MCT4737228.1 YcgJ family protein [Raoultella ornithinolytica]
MKKTGMILAVLSVVIPVMAGAAEHNKLSTPAPGVVCDAYLCADAQGISDGLTTRYLGEKKGQQLAAQGAFDRTTFTFANGVFCDTKSRTCRKDRYFGEDGKPSGTLDRTTTQLLFDGR